MELRTARLILRDFIEADVGPLYTYQSDPRYLQFYPWQTRTPEGVTNLVNRFIEWQHEQPRTRFQLAIVLPGRADPIGSCAVRTTNIDHAEAEFGCELSPDYWRRGFAAEAGRAMLDYGFTAMALHRVWAECVAENVAARRLVERVGMRQEGYFRGRTWMKDRWWDTVLYAILAEEWRGNGLAML